MGASLLLRFGIIFRPRAASQLSTAGMSLPLLCVSDASQDNRSNDSCFVT